MDSPQSVVSPFKNLSVASEPAKLSDFLSRNSSPTANGAQVLQSREAADYGRDDGFIGVLEVYVHQARDIHNICIYHKQDVYAKVCLTSDPDNSVSTKIINGGGKNPVFNDNLRLNVRTVETSLKCEVWMLSRVRNYLEDQLLGFALVPMSEVLLVGNGKLEKEFTLSSTDLFHSPAGFVQLSLAYSGAAPEVVAIPAAPPKASLLASKAAAAAERDSEISESDTSDLSKIEFPDPKVANENHLMVTEYFEMQCSSFDSQSSESYVSSDNENQLSSETGARAVESFSAGVVDSNQLQKPGSPPSSVSTNGSSPASAPASSQASDNVAVAPKSPQQEQISPLKEKADSVGDGETDSSGGGDAPRDAFAAKPVINVNVEPEQKMVQQDIVDMYMKSMQQFTESLAKMKLPLDLDNGQTNSGDSSTDDKKSPASKSNGSRVFYGSRAFF